MEHWVYKGDKQGHKWVINSGKWKKLNFGKTWIEPVLKLELKFEKFKKKIDGDEKEYSSFVTLPSNLCFD